MNVERPSIAARSLLEGGPDEYVTRRAEAVAEARRAGDKALATRLKGLKRPGLALWAVLVAGDDEDAVSQVVESTREVARVQAAGADRTALGPATAERRRALDRIVERAVGALAAATTPRCRSPPPGDRRHRRAAQPATRIGPRLARRHVARPARVRIRLRRLRLHGDRRTAATGTVASRRPPDGASRRRRCEPDGAPTRTGRPDPAELEARRRRRALERAEAALDTARRRTRHAESTAERARADADLRRTQWEAASHELDRAERELAELRADVERLTDEFEDLTRSDETSPS